MVIFRKLSALVIQVDLFEQLRFDFQCYVQRNHDCAYQGYYGVKDSDDSDNIRVQRRHPINIAREV